MPLSLEEALSRLARMVAADQEPTLDGTALMDLLEAHARATEWAAETAYSAGACVVSTGRNGRLYRCAEAGTSGETEPEWSLRAYVGQRTADGNDLVWEDAGPAFAELWDLNAAAKAGWLQKAAQLAHEMDFKSADQSFTLSQRIQNCERMAAKFEPALVF